MELNHSPEDIFIITFSISLILFCLFHHAHYSMKEKLPVFIPSDKKPVREEGSFAPLKEEYGTDETSF